MVKEWRLFCCRDSVARAFPYKQVHDKAGFSELLQMTAEDFDFLFSSSLGVSHWLLLFLGVGETSSMLDIWAASGTHRRASCLASLNRSHSAFQHWLASREPSLISLWSGALVEKLIKPISDLKIRAKVMWCELGITLGSFTEKFKCYSAKFIATLVANTTRQSHIEGLPISHLCFVFTLNTNQAELAYCCICVWLLTARQQSEFRFSDAWCRRVSRSVWCLYLSSNIHCS